MNIVDLSVPVRHGEGRLGLEVKFDTPYSYESCGWQGSTFSMFAHYGTHVDAPIHFIRDAATIEAAPLGKLIGPAGLIDLSDHCKAVGITADTLEDRGRHVRGGDIAVLRTGWSDESWGEDRFWRDGPWLKPDAADWLVERGVKAVVYDFSEEYVVHLGPFPYLLQPLYDGVRRIRAAFLSRQGMPRRQHTPGDRRYEPLPEPRLQLLHLAFRVGL